jgi:hypothetical protein
MLLLQHATWLHYTEDSLCERIRSETVLIRAAALTAIDDAALRELEAAFHLGEDAIDTLTTTSSNTNTTASATGSSAAKHDTDATASGATTPTTTSSSSSMMFGSGAGVQKLQALFSRSASSAV